MTLQSFDYGNTELEKRAIFFQRLLKFGPVRAGVDLSKVVLTHHTFKNRGTSAMRLGGGDAIPLAPITDAGRGSVQAKEKAWMREMIEKLNALFEGYLSDEDQLV